jgi:two-component system OmpR family sensor kinase
MTLRLRLTLLYTVLFGGILLIIGSLTYYLVSYLLVNQIDEDLTMAANELVASLRLNSHDQYELTSLGEEFPPENIYFQVWGGNSRLQLSQPPNWSESLDEEGLRGAQLAIHSTFSNSRHLRVLSALLISSRGTTGVLQVGINLNQLDTTQATLAEVLIIVTLVGMAITGVLVWFLTGRTLSPLSAVTKAATQITRTSDLSNRIEMTGERQDEVGKLIQAFNTTLVRLEELFNSQRRFLADVSHDLRTPLTVIKGNVDLLRKMGKVEEESLNSVDMEVNRLTRLVGDLLLLEQAETGRLPMESKLVALDDLLLQVFQQIRLLTGRRLRLIFKDIDELEVMGDRDRLKQVFINLLSNAVEYTPRGGSVTLSLKMAGNEAMTTIQDTGPGIPASDLPHIFERFYRGERSRKRHRDKGFGLGLSIAYWIIQQHEGRIEVESLEGHGTTFKVFLPLAEGEEEQRIQVERTGGEEQKRPVVLPPNLDIR